jgi:hypothetical protein
VKDPSPAMRHYRESGNPEGGYRDGQVLDPRFRGDDGKAGDSRLEEKTVAKAQQSNSKDRL